MGGLLLPTPFRSRNSQLLRDEVEPRFVLVFLDPSLKLPQAYLLPGGGSVVVSANEVARQGIELRFLHPRRAVLPATKVPDVQKRHDKEVERAERPLFHGKLAVAVGCISALDLNADLGDLAPFQPVPGVRVDTDQVVSLVPRRGLVRQKRTARPKTACPVPHSACKPAHAGTTRQARRKGSQQLGSPMHRRHIVHSLFEIPASPPKPGNSKSSSRVHSGGFSQPVRKASNSFAAAEIADFWSSVGSGNGNVSKQVVGVYRKPLARSLAKLRAH